MNSRVEMRQGGEEVITFKENNPINFEKGTLLENTLLGFGRTWSP